MEKRYEENNKHKQKLIVKYLNSSVSTSSLRIDEVWNALRLKFCENFPAYIFVVFPIFLPKISRIFPFRGGGGGGDETKACARAPSRKIERHRLAYL